MSKNTESSNNLKYSDKDVEGGLIALTSTGIVGWARDIGTPERVVHVILLVNDVASDAAMSNRFDLELVRARVGIGIPGFTMNVRRPAPKDFPLRLILREANGRVIGAPLVINDEAELTQFIEEERDDYEGMIDGIQNGMLLGWARSLTNPETAVVVELHDGTERIGRQAARAYRADLAASKKRDGSCAFAFELPITVLDGKLHSLRVSVAGTTIELQNSPVQFGPLVTSAFVRELVELRDEVTRLQRLVEIVAAPDGKLQTEIIRTLSERMAALAEIQRDLVERELDVLRSAAFRVAHSAIPVIKAKTPRQVPKSPRDAPG